MCIKGYVDVNVKEKLMQPNTHRNNKYDTLFNFQLNFETNSGTIDKIGNNQINVVKENCCKY